MEIRKYRESDIDNNLLELCYYGYTYHYDNRKDMFLKRDKEYFRNYLINNIDEINILVILDKNKIIGYIKYDIRGDNNQVLWISELIIDKDFQNKGYGKKLLNKARDIAITHNCNRIEFSCWGFNKKAIDKYNHMGFNKQRIIYEEKLK